MRRIILDLMAVALIVAIIASGAYAVSTYRRARAYDDIVMDKRIEREAFRRLRTQVRNHERVIGQIVGMINSAQQQNQPNQPPSSSEPPKK